MMCLSMGILATCCDSLLLSVYDILYIVSYV